MIALDIDARWAKIETDIVEFLNKCKSLNEAAKLVPNVVMYIHSDDMERLNRKVERQSQRKAIVQSVDTEGLTAAAIAAKLSAAS
jgi:ribosomal protein L35AE/L33A